MSEKKRPKKRGISDVAWLLIDWLIKKARGRNEMVMDRLKFGGPGVYAPEANWF